MQMTKTKAIVAGVVGVVTTTAVAIQTALSDDVITNNEKLTILIVAVGAVGAAFGVYAAENKPVPGPNDPPAGD